MKLPAIAFTTLLLVSVASAQEATPAPSASPAAKKPRTVEEQIKRYDKDGDGVVTLEEFTAKSKDKEKAKAKFEKRDKNKDGKLTPEELSPKAKGG